MKGLKCGKCGAIAKEARLRFQGFDVKGWKCAKCGEEYFHPEEAEKILLLNKLRKSEFKVKVGQIKSNLIVRIPKEAQKALGLEKGEELVLKVCAGKKMELFAK
ncbi:MAG: AbrB/MazE/SpoVT family DNA-binding domain-containing protein [Candidatus Diapherotrites archaeon]